MAIEFKQNKLAGKAPVFWRGEAKVLPGGFKPVQNFANGTVVKRGTLLFVDFDAMTAAVCKTATVLAGGTTTKIRVSKEHLFAVGDVVMKDGVTDKSPAISSIDTSNADYDVLNIASAITGIAEGDVIVEATAYVAAEGNEGQEGYKAAVPAAAKYTPNFIVAADKEFNGKGIPALDAAYDVVVLKDTMPQPVLAEWLNSCCLKSNPNILFIKQ